MPRPMAIMSWAAPMAGRCAPKGRGITASGRPAAQAILLKMRDTWPGGRSAADSPAPGDRAEEGCPRRCRRASARPEPAPGCPGRARRSRPRPPGRSSSGAPAAWHRSSARFPRRGRPPPPGRDLGPAQERVIGEGKECPVAVIDQLPAGAPSAGSCAAAIGQPPRLILGGGPRLPVHAL